LVGEVINGIGFRPQAQITWPWAPTAIYGIFDLSFYRRLGYNLNLWAFDWLCCFFGSKVMA